MLINVVGSLLQLPGLCLLLLIVAFLLRKNRRTAWGLVASCLVILYASSTYWVAGQLVATLNRYPALNLNKLPQGAQAIVVLGGGRMTAPELGGDGLSATSLMRMRYAALLYQKTQLPILTVGGVSQDTPLTTSQLMAKDLQDNYQVRHIWYEPKSRNTYENALYAKTILNHYKIDNFFLVTSAWHMPRAMMIFKAMGLNPIPASTDYRLDKVPASKLENWLPRADALLASSQVIHEYLGMGWVEIKKVFGK